MTPIDFHHDVQDNEFDALMNSVMQERRAAVPAGLEQRLTARLAQAAESMPTPASPAQFAHFGVLRDGANSKGAFLTSIFTNLAVAALLIIVSSAVHNQIVARETHPISYVVAVKDAPKPPPPPKLPPPTPLPETPKFTTPVLKNPPPVELPPDIKPVNVRVPKVNLAPPAPVKVEPPPAPRVVNLANAKAASLPNADPRPTAVRLGATDSPVKSTIGPAVSRVNLSPGVSGVPAGNSGNGAPAKAVTLGNGTPSGTDLTGKAAAATPVKGLAVGVLGATGSGVNGAVRVEIVPPIAKPIVPSPPTVAARKPLPPVVTFSPKPVYSAEAKAMHLEGDARINVRFLANGTVQVLGVAHGLGHGLDQAALEAAKGIQFRPALDPDGHPIDFQTTVIVHFLIN